MTPTGHVTDELPAYVLDLLEPDERQAVGDHLLACDACNTEHRRLASLPAMLGLLPPQGSAAASTPPTHLEEAVVARLVREGGPGRAPPRRVARRRRRWQVSAAAVAGALAGVAATLAVTDHLASGTAPERVRLAATDGSGASVDATLHAETGNTRIALEGADLAPTRDGEVYEVWLVNEAGRVSAGTFTVATRDAFALELNAAGSAKAYDRIGISLEPDGADPALNGSNVLAAPVRSS